MALPTFVIGGAPKAGTTALWALLAAHPQVWMSRTKEPRFLTRNLNNPAPGVQMIGLPREVTYNRGLSWYESLFAGGESCLARGEASPQYLGAVDGPELMERHVPGLKVIFVLRQPIERAYSHYWHHWQRGWQMPPFAAVLDDHPMLRYLLYMSRYAEHVERYRRELGTARVQLILFDDLRRHPGQTYAEICRFIGVDDAFRPQFDTEYNRRAAPASQPLQRAIARTKHRQWTFLPSIVRRPAHRLRRSLEAWNRRPADSPPLDPAVHDRLLDYFEDDISYVERLVRPLPGWRRRSDQALAEMVA